MGIDAAVHQAALDVGATTTAFLAGGMNHFTPRRHLNLARELVDGGGGYFTEQPFSQQPERHTFPVRNRLIAGASLATLVLEAARKSGALITANQAKTAEEIGPGNPVPNDSPDTTHYSVADADGNVVSNTYTLNFSFGSHIVVPGTGMLLNNEMDDFAAKAGAANAYGLVQGEANTIAPGRRPLSSMTPTLVLKNGQPWLAAGSPGGSLIITTVLQTLLNAMVFDMNIATAVAAPRVHNQWMPDRTLVEPGISADTQRLLEAWGHNLSPTRRTIGRSNSLMIDDGWMQGFADMRRPGGHAATE